MTSTDQTLPTEQADRLLALIKYVFSMDYSEENAKNNDPNPDDVFLNGIAYELGLERKKLL